MDSTPRVTISKAAACRMISGLDTEGYDAIRRKGRLKQNGVAKYRPLELGNEINAGF